MAFEEQLVLSGQPVVAVLRDQVDDARRLDGRVRLELYDDLLGRGVELADAERFAEQPQPMAVEQRARLRRQVAEAVDEF